MMSMEPEKELVETIKSSLYIFVLAKSTTVQQQQVQMDTSQDSIK